MASFFAKQYQNTPRDQLIILLSQLRVKQLADERIILDMQDNNSNNNKELDDLIINNPTGNTFTDLTTVRGMILNVPLETLQDDIEALNVYLNDTASGSSVQNRILSLISLIKSVTDDDLESLLLAINSRLVTIPGEATIDENITGIYDSIAPDPEDFNSTNLQYAINKVKDLMDDVNEGYTLLGLAEILKLSVGYTGNSIGERIDNAKKAIDGSDSDSLETKLITLNTSLGSSGTISDRIESVNTKIGYDSGSLDSNLTTVINSIKTNSTVLKTTISDISDKLSNVTSTIDTKIGVPQFNTTPSTLSDLLGYGNVSLTSDIGVIDIDIKSIIGSNQANLSEDLSLISSQVSTGSSNSIQIKLTNTNSKINNVVLYSNSSLNNHVIDQNDTFNADNDSINLNIDTVTYSKPVSSLPSQIADGNSLDFTSTSGDSGDSGDIITIYNKSGVSISGANNILNYIKTVFYRGYKFTNNISDAITGYQSLINNSNDSLTENFSTLRNAIKVPGGSDVNTTILQDINSIRTSVTSSPSDTLNTDIQNINNKLGGIGTTINGKIGDPLLNNLQSTLSDLLGYETQDLASDIGVTDINIKSIMGYDGVSVQNDIDNINSDIDGIISYTGSILDGHVVTSYDIDVVFNTNVSVTINGNIFVYEFPSNGVKSKDKAIFTNVADHLIIKNINSTTYTDIGLFRDYVANVLYVGYKFTKVVKETVTQCKGLIGTGDGSVETIIRDVKSKIGVSTKGDTSISSNIDTARNRITVSPGSSLTADIDNVISTIAGTNSNQPIETLLGVPYYNSTPSNLMTIVGSQNSSTETSLSDRIGDIYAGSASTGIAKQFSYDRLQSGIVTSNVTFEDLQISASVSDALQKFIDYISGISPGSSNSLVINTPDQIRTVADLIISLSIRNTSS